MYAARCLTELFQGGFGGGKQRLKEETHRYEAKVQIS